MSQATISPFVVSELKEVELTDNKGVKKKYWKKEILPSGTRKYKDETLDFSKINPACVKAFTEGATGPSVPFVLALADNKHPEPGQEAENLEGELHRLELGAKGELIGYFDLTHSEKVPSLIAKTNGKFGVSGRIEVDYERKDVGKKYEYALSHVCGTTRPHIKDLTPWEAVELSEEQEKTETIDFSTEVIDDTKQEETGDGLVTVNMKQEDVDRMLAFMKQQEDADAAAKKFLEGANGNGGTSDAPAELSEAAQKRIDMAEESAKQAFKLAEAAQIEASKTKWEGTRAKLLTEGVPPAILDEAAKVLALHKKVTLKLSDSDEVDATAVIQNILDNCKGVVKFSEEGHSVTDAGSTSASDKDFDEFEKSFLTNFGMS